MLPIYERIGTLCKLKGCTIDTLMTDICSEDVKSPRDVYNGWRRRSTYPRADEIVRIAKYFDVTAEYLVTGTDSNYDNDFVCKYRRFDSLLQKLVKLNPSDLKVIEKAAESMAK